MMTYTRWYNSLKNLSDQVANYFCEAFGVMIIFIVRHYIEMENPCHEASHIRKESPPPQDGGLGTFPL